MGDSFESLQLEVRRLSKQDKPAVDTHAQHVNNKMSHSEDRRSTNPIDYSELEDSTISTTFSKNAISRSGDSKVVVKQYADRQPTYMQNGTMNRSQARKDFEFRNTFDYPTCKYNEYSCPQVFDMESHRVSF